MTAPTEHHDTAPEADPDTGELPWDGFKDGRIQNFLGLDWAGKKLAEYERGIAQNEAVMNAELKRVVDRTLALNEPFRQKVAFWRTAIEEYAKVHRSEILIGRQKTRETPSGLVLKWRERKEGEYRYDQRPGPDGKPSTPAENKAALLAWAQKECTGGTLVKQVPVPDLDAIKHYLAGLDAAVNDDDRLKKHVAPPGLEWVEPGETLSVTTKGESK